MEQIQTLHRRGIYPHNIGHRLHVVTLQGLAWVDQFARAKLNAGGRALMGAPMLAEVAAIQGEKTRRFFVQAVKLQPYPDRSYFQLVAYVGKTPPPRPWTIFIGTSVPRSLEISHEYGCPFSTLDGYPVELRITQEEQESLTKGDLLRFDLVESLDLASGVPV